MTSTVIQKLKLGTRRSLLAWAQSSGVARALEKKHPGLHVELVGIETQGDKILDKPLSQVEGKEFFTAELDHALLAGKVDLTVHSMKDLSLDRPAQLQLAATPTRELQHDVIVFNTNVLERLKAGKEIRIGTSSPRRLTLIPEFLKNALPQFGPPLQLKFVEIRGNVNTRVSRVHEADTSPKKVDGVVLAFAGLERLAQDEKASLELWRLFENTRLMILPLRECPTAPAQGAIAIECHRDQPEVLKIISSLHDAGTLAGVKLEREVLQEWGGGCHQKLGASLVGQSLFIHGEKLNGEKVNEIRGERHPDFSRFYRVEAKHLFDFVACPLDGHEMKVLEDAPQVFIAHSRALAFLNPALHSDLTRKRVWVSGTQSWFKLAAQGIWVEGSVESQGFEKIAIFAVKKLLRFKEKNWAFLTHKESTPSPHALLVSTYEHRLKSIPAEIENATHLYWTSGLPFQTIWSSLSAAGKVAFQQKTHACGPGKTATLLRAHGIEPILGEVGHS
jgi:hydroxymethylbilane synthase